jgi:aryl-alcohol dehydrogenase-like predicted oxidoreductase
MHKQKFGSTSLNTTKMGLGLAAIGRPGYINVGHGDDFRRKDVESVKKQAFSVLDTAWDNGIRYFDAARSYGLAESFLFSWLEERHISPDDVVVGSKWGYVYTADWAIDVDVHEVKDHSTDVLVRQWAESQRNLGRFLNIYQIHSATEESGVLQNDDVLDQLWELKRNGIVIGLTVSGPHQADTIYQALEVQRDGVRLFESVQATWNILERSTTAALQTAYEAGWGVIVKEALANGRLTTRGIRKRGKAKHFRPLSAVAERLDTSIDALALQAVMAQPWADVVLSGASKARHLRSNLYAFDVDWQDDILDELEALVESPEDYWQTRSRLKWT